MKSKQFLLCLLLLLTGCNPFLLFAPDSQKIVQKGWAENPPPKAIEPVYCYHTLADKVCHKRPLEGEEKRLSGYFGPYDE